MDYDELERGLKVAQMRADIENKQADTIYKQGLVKYEPWKVVVSALAASAAIFGVLGGIAGYFLRSIH